MDGIKRISPNRRFSEGVIHNGVVYVSGQVDYQKHRGIGDQTRAVLRLLDEILESAGSDKHHLLHVNIYVANVGDIPGMNVAWEEWVSKEEPPARTVLQSDFADMGWLIKISAVAAVVL